MSNLPIKESMSDVVALLGENVAGAIVRHFAGTKLYIPEKLSPGHKIIEGLGEETARELIFNFSGCHIQVPLSLYQEDLLRREQVLELARQGKRHCDISSLSGTTERNVMRIIRKAREQGRDLSDTRQGKDF